MIKFIKINMSGEHEQSDGDEFFTPSSGVGEPPTGYSSGAFGADVIGGLNGLAQMINQRLQFGPSGG